MNTGNCDLHFESEKEIEDVKLLVESMKYQKDDPCQQQQALRALGEILSQNKRTQDYFCSSSGLEYVLSLCKIAESPAVSQSALYTLAMATEGNDFSQRTLTKKSVFHLLRSHLQAKNRPTATRSAFLLMTICDGNCEGQNLAKETKCLHSLCELYKGCLPICELSSFSDDRSERWFSNIEENCLQLWSVVVLALQSLLQNPQNRQNQWLCCRLLPMIVNILQQATKQQNIVVPTTTLISAIVSGNADCQSKLRLLGGLRALINQLKEHVEQEELANQNIPFMEHIVNTIGSTIAGHAICLDSSADLGLVSLLLKCLDISRTLGVDDAVSNTFRTKCILALSICVDQCERNQQQLRDREGVERLVELLAQEQSEEFRRVAIFVLHCITGNSQVIFNWAVIRFMLVVCEKLKVHSFGLNMASSADGRKPLLDKRTKKGQPSDIQTDSGNDFSKVPSPTQDAETQTDLEETQPMCNTKLRKKRILSTKVLQPLIRPSKTACSKKTSAGPTAKLVTSNVDRPRASTSQDATECEACETILNSKNFLKTLRHCSRLCSYHRELGKLLHRKNIDLKRRR